MPIVAQHHAWKDSEHIPRADWPEDCYVQWGGSGVVISKAPGASYKTAFFEAFPKNAGFIRGEGATIAEAEAAAFKRYVRESACQHQWGRRGYTNGGAICARCGAFQSVFNPIIKLGKAFAPLDPSSLNMVADGHMRPDPEDSKSNRYQRRCWLKARRMGIDLPDFATAPPEPAGFEEDDYTRASRQAVASWLRENLHSLEETKSGAGLEGMFSSLHRAALQRLIDQDDALSAGARRDAPEDEDGCSGPS